MELFKGTNFDFLGKKWPFIIISLVFIGAGLGSLVIKGGPEYGIDFRGGAMITVKFAQKPPDDRIRAAVGAKIPGEISVVQVTGTQEVLIGTELRGERELETARGTIIATLASTFGSGLNKLDFHNSGWEAIANQLRDPLQRSGGGISDSQLETLVKAMLTYRDTPPRSGLIASFDDLAKVPGVTPAVIAVLKQECQLAPFAIRNVEIVGPKVGAELRTKAMLATLYALGGMLVYIALRFEWIYGFAAVIAVFHDTVITIGLFSIFNKPIDLTVVAAVLTLVGYSMNDTIVIFDRIRENLKILRREELEPLINKSINQTLSRTILTSGLTLLTALALFLFGGQVLSGFAFALVVGIVVGTYSTVFIASPILIFWQQFLESRKKAVPVAVAAGRKSVK